jgi:hypothetical protein
MQALHEFSFATASSFRLSGNNLHERQTFAVLHETTVVSGIRNSGTELAVSLSGHC